MRVSFTLVSPTLTIPYRMGVDQWMIVRGSERRDLTAERLLVLLGFSIGIAYCIALLWHSIDGRWLLYLPSMLVMT